MNVRKGNPKSPIQRSQETKTKKRKRQTVNDGRPPDTSQQLIRGGKGTKKTKSAGPNAPAGRLLITENDFIRWSFKYESVHATNTCALDSPLMLLFLLRRHGIIAQQHFQADEKLTEVLNLIDIGDYDKARVSWLMHLKSVCAPRNLNLTGNHWNLWGDSSLYTSCSLLFRLKMKNVYDVCSNLGRKCPLAAMYHDEPGQLATMPHDVSRIEVFIDRYANIQDFFDAEYNSFGKKSATRGKNFERVCLG